MSTTYRCRVSFSFAGVLRLAVSIGVAVERPALACDRAEGAPPFLAPSEAEKRVLPEGEPGGFQCSRISENPSSSSR